MTEQQTNFLAQTQTIGIALDISDWINELQFGTLPLEVKDQIALRIILLKDIPIPVLKYIYNMNTSDLCVTTALTFLYGYYETHPQDREFADWFYASIEDTLLHESLPLAQRALVYYRLLASPVPQEAKPEANEEAKKQLIEDLEKEQHVIFREMYEDVLKEEELKRDPFHGTPMHKI